MRDSLEAIKVLDTIAHMPDVIEWKKLFESNPESHRKLSSWIAGKPGKQPFYWVAVGEDSGNAENLVHLNFRVYPDSMRIVFYDVVNEKELSLDEWREKNK